MSIADTDVIFRMSGGTSNGTPANSLGGAVSLVYPGNLTPTSGVMGNLWDFVPLSEATSGLAAEYRCIYVMNNNANGVSLVNATLWYEALNVDSQVINMMGLDPAGLNGVAQTIANETTVPVNVSFSQPTTKDTGLSLGTIPAGSFYPFWLSRQIQANAGAYYQDYFILRVEGEPPAALTSSVTAGAPPPPPPPMGTGVGGDFGIAIAGEWSCSSAATTSINNIISRQTSTPPMQLLLAGGNISYNADPTCWFNLTLKIDAKTRITFGTLENDTELGSQPGILNTWLRHYGLYTQYYSFDHGTVHVLNLSTEIPYGSTSPQYLFAVSDLQEAASNSSINWIIVRMHQSMYSVGGTGDVNKFNHVSFITTYGPLFDLYGVDLVVSSHPKNYQRTLPVTTNLSTPSSPKTAIGITLGTSDYTAPKGTIYLNAGTGGTPLDTTTLSPTSVTASTDSSDNGYLYITITLNGSLLKGTFYNASNIAVDQFSITHL